MPEQPFTYKPEDDVAVSKYEYVQIKPNSLRNITDFHDIQSIVKYKQALAIKELLGNLRVSETTSDPISVTADNRFQANGIFYFDGYRLNIDGLQSAQIPSTGTYYIYLFVKYDVITMNDEPRIGLQDTQLNTLIETSYRYKFTYLLKYYDSDSPDNAADIGYQASYKLGKMTYTADEWTYSEDNASFQDIPMQYADAISNVMSAIHKHTDGWTELSKLTTKWASNLDTIDHLEVEQTDNNIRITFKDSSGNAYAAYEAVKIDNAWKPIIWLQQSDNENELLYITPDEINIVSNSSLITSIKKGEFTLKDGSSLFSYANNKFNVRYANNDGIKVEFFRKNGVLHNKSFNQDSNNLAGNINDGQYENSSTFNTINNSIYTLSIENPDPLSTDNVYTINYKISHTDKEAGVYARVYQSTDNGASYELLNSQMYIMNESNSVIVDNIKFSLTDSAIDAYYAGIVIQIKLVFSIVNREDSEDIFAIVGLKASNQLTWYTYDAIHSAINGETLLVNDYILWIDNNGNLRVKAKGTSIADTIEAIKNNTAGNSPTASGGMSVGSNYSIQNIVISNSVDGNAITQPYFDINTGTLYFPTADAAKDGGGLLSQSQYNSLLSSVGSFENLYAKSDKIIYVAKEWSTSTPSKFSTSISSAIDKLPSGGIIIVYPGTYIEDIFLKGHTNIIALDPDKTEIVGTVTFQGSENYIKATLLAGASSAIEATNDSSSLEVEGYIRSSTLHSVIDINANNSTVTLKNVELKHTVGSQNINDGTININNNTANGNIKIINSNIESNYGNTLFISVNQSGNEISPFEIDNSIIKSTGSRAIYFYVGADISANYSNFVRFKVKNSTLIAPVSDGSTYILQHDIDANYVIFSPNECLVENSIFKSINYDDTSQHMAIANSLKLSVVNSAYGVVPTHDFAKTNTPITPTTNPPVINNGIENIQGLEATFVDNDGNPVGIDINFKALGYIAE